MNQLKTFFNELNIIKGLVYDKYGFIFTNLKQNIEGKEYGACNFELNGTIIHHRVSKATPKKIGQFVTLWKRNKLGITEPYDYSDDFDFIFITVKEKDKLGQFIFPKKVLEEKGIISKNGKEGKRGIRVYPPWDKVLNNQARKSQNWQSLFFLSIKNDNSIEQVTINLLFKSIIKDIN